MAHRATDPPDRPDESRRGAGDRAEPLITRADLAGWVDGPGGGRAAGRWPGDLLGLPQRGPASMATAARRFGALCIDWALALVVSNLVFGGEAIATLLVFAVMHVVGITLLATTVGKALLRTQVVRVGGRTAPVHRVLVRTVLLCLVLPAVVVDPDGRGMHDRVAGTVEIRM
ncbi:RDD family protein [Micrococcaceae bacterium Sec6.3]